MQTEKSLVKARQIAEILAAGENQPPVSLSPIEEEIAKLEEIVKDVLWTTSSGSRTHVVDMTDTHLLNTLIHVQERYNAVSLIFKRHPWLKVQEEVNHRHGRPHDEWLAIFDAELVRRRLKQQLAESRKAQKPTATTIRSAIFNATGFIEQPGDAVVETVETQPEVRVDPLDD